jgi:hypothetical protein
MSAQCCFLAASVHAFSSRTSQAIWSLAQASCRLQAACRVAMHAGAANLSCHSHNRIDTECFKGATHPYKAVVPSRMKLYGPQL